MAKLSHLTVALVKSLYESDVREERLEQIYQLLRGYVKAHGNQIRALGQDPEDFVQDVVHAIFRRKGLDNYDPSKGTSFETLIFRIAKNAMIDLGRKVNAKSRVGADGRPIRPVSMSTPLRNRDSGELGDLLGDGAKDTEAPDEEEGEDPGDRLVVTDDGELDSAGAEPSTLGDQIALDLTHRGTDNQGTVARRVRLALKRYGIENYGDYLQARKNLKGQQLAHLDALFAASKGRGEVPAVADDDDEPNESFKRLGRLAKYRDLKVFEVLATAPGKGELVQWTVRRSVDEAQRFGERFFGNDYFVQVVA